MRGFELLDNMNLIDPAYIESADISASKKKNVWIKWSAVAACFCLIVSFTVYQLARGYDTYTETIDSFCLDESYPNVYVQIQNEHLQQLGLQNYKIKKSDLGEKMGVTANCQDERLNGCPVYHFSKYPDKDFICIVDTPSGYAFYTIGFFKGIWETEAIGTSSDFIFEAYGLPKTIEKTEVYANEDHLFDIENSNAIDHIFFILSAKSNVGSKTYLQRKAQVWYEAYGNDDIIYDPQTGSCGVKVKDSYESLTSHTDENGNSVAQSNPDAGFAVYEKARALWNKNMRTIIITTVRGYRININYFPATRVFNIMGGYYEISEEEAEILNELLQIEA